MARPRIDGWADRTLAKLVKRGVFKSYGEAVHAAVKLLMQEQMRKEAGSISVHDPEMDRMQAEVLGETVGNLSNKPNLGSVRKRTQATK